jgi:FkbM family methyltransferase
MSSSLAASPADPAAQPLWVTVSATAIRVLPFGRYRAANTLARLSRRPFLARLPVDSGGSLFECDLRDSIAREVCFTGRYEPQETEIARRLLRHGDAVIDVGANWGYFTLLSAYLVGSAGRVIALEPHPRLHERLASNIERNGLRHVTCLELAGADARGTGRFVESPDRLANSGLTRPAATGERADFDAPGAPIDEVAARHGLDRVALVKIDVEGGESDVLRGMADGLRGRRYRFVLLECHPDALARKRVSIDECLRPLVDAGYRGLRIDHSPDMHRRAASASVPLGDMLAPMSPESGPDGWPHSLWTAPGEALAF